jgi:hypothetical protein
MDTTRVNQVYSKFGNQSVTWKGDRVTKVTEWTTGVPNSTVTTEFKVSKKSRKKA